MSSRVSNLVREYADHLSQGFVDELNIRWCQMKISFSFVQWKKFCPVFLLFFSFSFSRFCGRSAATRSIHLLFIHSIPKRWRLAPLHHHHHHQRRRRRPASRFSICLLDWLLLLSLLIRHCSDFYSSLSNVLASLIDVKDSKKNETYPYNHKWHGLALLYAFVVVVVRLLFSLTRTDKIFIG